MATNPQTLTPKKVPTKVTPNSKSSAKSQNIRKVLNVKKPGNTGQQQTSSPSASHETTLAGNKRKIKNEDNLQIKMSPATKFPDPDFVGAQMITEPKKQKTLNELTNSNLLLHLAQTQPNTEPVSQVSPQTPQRTQQQQLPVSTQASAGSMSNALLQFALSSNPKLLPSNPTLAIITSTEIDNIAYAMWELAMKQGPMLATACGYSGMFSHLKLSALAKLNFLPSWWFFREMSVQTLRAPREAGGMGLTVDDSVMEKTWSEAVIWSRQLLIKNNSMRSQEGAERTAGMKDGASMAVE